MPATTAEAVDRRSTASAALGKAVLYGLLIGGALVASVFMITVESIVDIWSPSYAVVVFYAALVLVLLIKPTGLFGKREARAQ